jgi:predicted PurR-regulated permease PerM
VGVVPPSLFGLVQFSGWEAALVPLGVAGVQLLMGHFVDPLLQGRYLALSPYVVLVAVTFWGWLWGVAGAFLSMPITVGIAVACQQSERTRWLATFLAEDAHGRYARRIEDQR